MHDWAATMLGPVETWPASRRTVVDLVLASPLPSALLVGEDLVAVINPALAALLPNGAAGFGRPLHETLPDAASRVHEALAGALAGRTELIADEPLFPEDVGPGAPRTWDIALTPQRDEAGAVAGVLATLVETTSRTAERRLRALVDGIPQLVWRAVDLGSWNWSGTRWEEVTGQTLAQSAGWGWLDAVHPDDRTATRAAWEGAEARGGLTVEHRLYDIRERRHRWHQTSAAPVRDEAGRIMEWLGACTDVDEAHRLRESQGLLVAELHHRTRNLIATVRAIAGQTARRTTTTAEFRGQFELRLSALSRAQDLLARADRPLTLHGLVSMELAAAGIAEDAAGLRVDGPHVPLEPRMIQTLALAFHELSTNARKHGAFAVSDGRLSVTWEISSDDEGRRVVLDWQEEADIDAPAEVTAGYGRELVERALPYMLGARTTYALGAGGLRCRIDLPLGRGGGERASGEPV